MGRGIIRTWLRIDNLKVPYFENFRGDTNVKKLISQDQT